MAFILLFILLFFIELVYIELAKKLKILDNPNSRSSHIAPTIRGGGILFPIAALFFFVFFGNEYGYLILAILVCSTISFIDDIKGLSNILRFTSHLISTLLILYQINFPPISGLLLILLIIIIIGVMNIFNFMDGINGMSGLYSLVTFISLLYLNLLITFTSQGLLILMTSAVIIFLIFNFRKNAICFSGDVGSISISLIIVFCILLAIIKTGSLRYFNFMLIYFIDSGLTITQRLFLKQNIFKAHRMHLYQILANESKISHLQISICYALLQMIINFFIIQYSISTLNSLYFIGLPCILVYIVLKANLLNAISYRSQRIKKD